jgi:hypothetical protein
MLIRPHPNLAVSAQDRFSADRSKQIEGVQLAQPIAAVRRATFAKTLCDGLRTLVARVPLHSTCFDMCTPVADR